MLAPAQHVSYTHFEVILSLGVSSEVEVEAGGAIFSQVMGNKNIPSR